MLRRGGGVRRRRASACRVLMIKPPTVINPDGTYYRYTAPVPVKVCGGSVTFPTSDGEVTVKLRDIEKQARRYLQLANEAGCPAVRSIARELAGEWGSFHRVLKVVK